MSSCSFGTDLDDVIRFPLSSSVQRSTWRCCPSCHDPLFLKPWSVEENKSEQVLFCDIYCKHRALMGSGALDGQRQHIHDRKCSLALLAREPEVSQNIYKTSTGTVKQLHKGLQSPGFWARVRMQALITRWGPCVRAGGAYIQGWVSLEASQSEAYLVEALVRRQEGRFPLLLRTGSGASCQVTIYGRVLIKLLCSCIQQVVLKVTGCQASKSCEIRADAARTRSIKRKILY